MPLDYPRLSYDGAWVELRGIRSATQPQFLKKHPSLIGTHFYYLLNEELGQIDNVKLSLQTSFSNLMITNEAQMKTNKQRKTTHTLEIYTQRPKNSSATKQCQRFLQFEMYDFAEYQNNSQITLVSKTNIYGYCSVAKSSVAKFAQDVGWWK